MEIQFVYVDEFFFKSHASVLFFGTSRSLLMKPYHIGENVVFQSQPY